MVAFPHMAIMVAFPPHGKHASFHPTGHGSILTHLSPAVSSKWFHTSLVLCVSGPSPGLVLLLDMLCTVPTEAEGKVPLPRNGYLTLDIETICGKAEGVSW